MQLATLLPGQFSLQKGRDTMRFCPGAVGLALSLSASENSRAVAYCGQISLPPLEPSPVLLLPYCACKSSHWTATLLTLYLIGKDPHHLLGGPQGKPFQRSLSRLLLGARLPFPSPDLSWQFLRVFFTTPCTPCHDTPWLLPQLWSLWYISLATPGSVGPCHSSHCSEVPPTVRFPTQPARHYRVRETDLGLRHSAPCRRRSILVPTLPGREPAAPLPAGSGTAAKGGARSPEEAAPGLGRGSLPLPPELPAVCLVTHVYMWIYA